MKNKTNENAKLTAVSSRRNGLMT